MTASRLLLICLAITVIQGCGSIGRIESSDEMISRGEKSISYCFSESVDTVVDRIAEYFDACYAHPAYKTTVDTGGYYDSKSKFFIPGNATDVTHPEGKTLKEDYFTNKRVSFVEGDYFSKTADATENKGSSDCPTSVVFYERKLLIDLRSVKAEHIYRDIEQYIKIGDLGANCSARKYFIKPNSFNVDPAASEPTPPAIQPAVIKSDTVVSSIVEDSTVKTPQPQSGNAVQRLKDLKALYEEGLINKKDFEIKKQEILKAM